jgi:hypothetical protein
VKPEPKPVEDEDDFPPADTGARIVILKPGETYDPLVQGAANVLLRSKIVILPSNGRENIAQERERQRLELFAELPVAGDDDEPAPPPPPPPPLVKKLTGRERLRLFRAKRRAAREAEE